MQLKRALACLGCACALPMAAQAPALTPATALKHIVVIYQENVSFDHYFATYPHALNPPGEPPFQAAPGTPAIDGLSGALLTDNPNKLNPANGASAANPFRLGRDQTATPDMNHSYTQEQIAYDHGKMDFFPIGLGLPGPPPGSPAVTQTQALDLSYFDGNTVTALWNYAQRYALEDHFFQTTFGPSVIGAINLVSGQTNGIVAVRNGTSPNVVLDGGGGSFTVMGDADPIGDVCDSPVRVQITMGGPNIGDLLNAAHLSWGWFQDGFDLGRVNPDSTTGCLRAHKSDVTGITYKDYVPHHEPFQYYPSTANPRHLRPSSVAAIGHDDGANHNYDLEDFFAAVEAGNFPTVSFLKPAAWQNGHAGYSDPLDEQQFLVRVLNFLQSRPEWASTAVLLTWDDTDGWYDHVEGPIVNSSVGPGEVLNGDGICGDGTHILSGIGDHNPHALGRCGYGPRVPMLLLSPWAKSNYVSSTVADQTSILRFIEDVFLDARRLGQGSFDVLAGPLDGMLDFTHPPNLKPLLLDEKTGEPVPHP